MTTLRQPVLTWPLQCSLMGLRTCTCMLMHSVFFTVHFTRTDQSVSTFQNYSTIGWQTCIFQCIDLKEDLHSSTQVPEASVRMKQPLLGRSHLTNHCYSWGLATYFVTVLFIRYEIRTSVRVKVLSVLSSVLTSYVHWYEVSLIVQSWVSKVFKLALPHTGQYTKPLLLFMARGMRTSPGQDCICNKSMALDPCQMKKQTKKTTKELMLPLWNLWAGWLAYCLVCSRA